LVGYKRKEKKRRGGVLMNEKLKESLKKYEIELR